MSWYDPDREDTTIYKVVMNHEEQYSIWPADRENPLGWSDVGKSGPKAECLEYIKEVWTDMRPLSLRKQMEEAALHDPADDEPMLAEDEPGEDDLVKRLSEGEHPVEASLRPEKTVEAFKERIDMGYVHIKFTDTRGGTELGVRLDPGVVDLNQADFANKTGTVHLEGGLTLNYVKVRCIADIDLLTLTGKGHLVPAEA
ncbi:MAG: MbtH family protein [Pyrinomonadaceae bacterium]